MDYACSAPTQHDAERGVLRGQKAWAFDGHAKFRDGDSFKPFIRAFEIRLYYLEEICPKGCNEKPDQTPSKGHSR